MPSPNVGPKGARLDFEPLFRRLAGDGQDSEQPDQLDCSVNLVARALGVSRTTVRRARQDGISYYTADQFACRAGLHPANVWPDQWWEIPALALTEDQEEDPCLMSA